MAFEKIDMKDVNRPEGRRCLLIYGFSQDELRLTESYSKFFGVDDVFIVGESQLDDKIDDLLKVEKKIINSVNVKYGNDKFIIFNAFSNKDIHDYINEFKNQIDLNPIFAVITPHSLKWKFRDLIRELVNERREMSRR